MTRYDTGNNQGRNDDEGPGLLGSWEFWLCGFLCLAVWMALFAACAAAGWM